MYPVIIDDYDTLQQDYKRDKNHLEGAKQKVEKCKAKVTKAYQNADKGIGVNMEYQQYRILLESYTHALKELKDAEQEVKECEIRVENVHTEIEREERTYEHLKEDWEHWKETGKYPYSNEEKYSEREHHGPISRGPQKAQERLREKHRKKLRETHGHTGDGRDHQKLPGKYTSNRRADMSERKNWKASGSPANPYLVALDA